MKFSFSSRWKWRSSLKTVFDSQFGFKCFCPFYFKYKGREYVPFGFEITGGFDSLTKNFLPGPKMKQFHFTILNFDFYIGWEVKGEDGN